ncbi:MAG: hypothetical protein JNN12_02945 [Bacteroidetes Order II. Incertae sedis bacterium]|nr:hypothetical protein [Bacteroidetes Order II. bacterium]
MQKLFFWLAIWCCLHGQSHAQNTIQNEPITVFLDCNTCDSDYFRTEIPFVQYVIDRSAADLHVLFTVAQTGSGGQSWAIDFIGQKRLDGRKNGLRFNTESTATKDEVRQTQVRYLKVGLLPYVLETHTFDQVTIGYAAKQNTAEKPTEKSDKWNKWTFSLTGGGSLNAQSIYSDRTMMVSANGDRTTDRWKTGAGVYFRKQVNKVTINNTPRTYTQESQNVYGRAVYSLAPLWSLKLYSGFTRSTYDNYDAQFSVSPSIEYSIFPYTESTKRSLKFQVGPDFAATRYLQKTVFGKLQENTWGQVSKLIMQWQQPWGSINGSVTASNLLNDPKKNRFSVGGNVEWRVVKGLNLVMGGYASRIRDQINLVPEVGEDEILLRNKLLATNFAYQTFMQIRYTFGSLTNNIVNTRFDESGFFIYGF